MIDVRECYAYHEGGHIVLGCLYNEFVDANLDQTAVQCGQTNNKNTFENMSREACLSFLIAGPIAERIYRQSTGHEELDSGKTDSNDYYKAVLKIGYDPIFDDDERFQQLKEQIQEEFGGKVTRVLKDKWPAVMEIANKLLTNGYVDENEADSILRKNQNSK
jgi:hypothetical protein